MPHIYIHTKELEFHSFDKHHRDTHLFSVMPTYANYTCFFDHHARSGAEGV